MIDRNICGHLSNMTPRTDFFFLKKKPFLFGLTEEQSDKDITEHTYALCLHKTSMGACTPVCVHPYIHICMLNPYASTSMCAPYSYMHALTLVCTLHICAHTYMCIPHHWAHTYLRAPTLFVHTLMFISYTQVYILTTFAPCSYAQTHHLSVYLCAYTLNILCLVIRNL